MGLRIWQENVNTLDLSQHGTLNTKAYNNYNVIAFQKPYIDFLNNTRALHDWHIIYPLSYLTINEPKRLVILIRSNLLSCSWRQINFPSNDVIMVQFSGDFGTFTLFNIYNDCNHQRTLTTLGSFCQQKSNVILPTVDTYLVWLGDFNHHHPLWDCTEDTRLFTTDAIVKSNFLLYTLADLNLHMALSLGTPTYYHLVTKKWSHLNNVFCMPHTPQALVSCDAMPGLQGPTTNHIPIVSIFNLPLLHKDLPPRQDFHGTD